jgi:hypothetical protein
MHSAIRHSRERRSSVLSVASKMKGRFQVRRKLELDGGLILAMLGSGLLMVPLGGWLPFILVAAACGASVYVVNMFNARR